MQNTKAKPRVVIHGSAVCYPFDTPQPCDESSPYGINFLAEVTRQCENSVSRIQDLGTRLVIIRSGIVLGKGGGALEPMLIPFRFFLGSYFGTGKQYLPWISLDDEIDAILFLMEHENLNGVFNLTSPEPVQMKEFCRIIRQNSQKAVPFLDPVICRKISFGPNGR